MGLACVCDSRTVVGDFRLEPTLFLFGWHTRYDKAFVAHVAPLLSSFDRFVFAFDRQRRPPGLARDPAPLLHLCKCLFRVPGPDAADFKDTRKLHFMYDSTRAKPRLQTVVSEVRVPPVIIFVKWLSKGDTNVTAEEEDKKTSPSDAWR